jgi:hypothetical protein
VLTPSRFDSNQLEPKSLVRGTFTCHGGLNARDLAGTKPKGQQMIRRTKPWRAAAMVAPIMASLFVLTPSAEATESASNYNGPIQGRAYECITPRNPKAPIESWALDGTDTKFRFNGIRWSGDKPCKPGKLRVSQFPPVKINGTTMYMQRGSGGSTQQDTEAIRHGHVRVGELSKRPALVRPTWPNGRPCARETDTLYYNYPQPIPENFEYKPNEKHSDWENYGDPAQTDGSFNPPGTHYSYALWSWLTDDKGRSNPGGGQPRAIVNKGDRIRRCDVRMIKSRAYAEGSNDPIGEVRGFYGRVRSNSGEAVDGWFVHSWRRTSDKEWHCLVSVTPTPETPQCPA